MKFLLSFRPHSGSPGDSGTLIVNLAKNEVCSTISRLSDLLERIDPAGLSLNPPGRVKHLSLVHLVGETDIKKTALNKVSQNYYQTRPLRHATADQPMNSTFHMCVMAEAHLWIFHTCLDCIRVGMSDKMSRWNRYRISKCCFRGWTA